MYEGNTDAERLSGVLDELVQHRPKIVILDPHLGPQKVRHKKALFDPYLERFRYKEIATNILLRED